MIENQTARYVYHLDSNALTTRLPMFLEDLRMTCVKNLLPQSITELTSMNEQDDGPLLLLASFPALGFHNPSLHILISRTLEPELFALAQFLGFQV